MDLIQVADSVAREKSIDREEVIEAMELAIQKAGRSRYGHERDIRAHIDRKKGGIKMHRYMEVVDDVENDATQITPADAKRRGHDLAVGEFMIEELPPMDFGHIAAQTAKQVISQKVREAERRRQFNEYKDRVGEIVNGLVKRVDYNNVIIDLGKAEAVVRREEQIPREHFKTGDRIRAYIFDVREEVRGPQIFLSRTHPEFMSGLFKAEVPEIYDGIITVKAVARDAGSRAKIGVISRDSSIDPVGACVGMRGSRVQAVVNELQGEKIDIIPWSEDTATFVVNALAPAEVSKVVMDEDDHRIEVVVPDEQLSLAIGRRGQNVRLACQLTGWDIDIMTEAEESEKRQAQFKRRSERFMKALDVDDVIAHLLVAEGFSKVEEFTYVDTSELATIEGFDEDIAEEIKNRAATFLEEEEAEFAKKRKDLGIAKDLEEFEALPSEMIIKLGESDIKTLDDLADLAGDELREILGDDSMTEKEANEVIMAARAHWFEEEEQAAAKAAEAAEGPEGDEQQEMAS